MGERLQAGSPGPVRVADGVTLLDLSFQATPGVIGAWLLEGDGEAVLIETGPASTRENLEHMVRQAGYKMANISRLIVTHIHLDHAGAAGVLLRDYPHLRLSVQEDAAPFLISVDRLWNSATRIYGDEMLPLWGETIDADASRVDTFRDGDRLRVAGTTLRVVATPGHSGTHVSFFDEQRGILFTGDAAGARIGGSSILVPTLSPPEIDIDLWKESIDRMKALEPERLALTHMGIFDDAVPHLDGLMPAIRECMEIADRVLQSPDDESALAEALTLELRGAFENEGGDVDRAYAAMQYAMPTWLAAKGIVRVFKKAGKFDPA